MAGSKNEVPFSITPVEEGFNPISTSSKTMVRVGPSGYVLPEKYQEFAYYLYSYPTTPDVAWVTGFPRSGTTMTQELVWLIHNDCDFEGAKKDIQRRVKHIASCFNTQFKFELDEDDNPNVIKIHLAFDLLPSDLLDKCKVVFIARNPKDVAVSLFNFLTDENDFDDFWKRFQADKVIYGPFFKVVLQGWAKRNHRNLLFLFYEETQKDMRGTILKVAKHFAKKLTEEQITTLEEHMDFKNFKKNKASNLEAFKSDGRIKSDFIRKGGTGGWREYFSKELNASADAWIKESLEGTDFAFPEN